MRNRTLFYGGIFALLVGITVGLATGWLLWGRNLVQLSKRLAARPPIKGAIPVDSNRPSGALSAKTEVPSAADEPVGYPIMDPAVPDVPVAAASPASVVALAPAAPKPKGKGEAKRDRKAAKIDAKAAKRDGPKPDEKGVTPGVKNVKKPGEKPDAKGGPKPGQKPDNQVHDLMPTVKGAPPPLIHSTFEKDAAGFAYADDVFRATKHPDHARGDWIAGAGLRGGVLRVNVGGRDSGAVTDMSGGWQRAVTLDKPASLVMRVRYRLSMASEYEEEELSAAMLSIGKKVIGAGGKDWFALIYGDGNGGPVMKTGWRVLEARLRKFPVGKHLLTVGAYNTKKSSMDEVTELLVDEIWVGFEPPKSRYRFRTTKLPAGQEEVKVVEEVELVF
jgi:hypothetical protein